MRRAALIIVLSLTGLVLLAVVALGIFFAAFDPNAYKDNISAAVKEQTGRDLVFHGDLEVSFFPVPGLKTGRITMTEPEDFGAEPFAELESVSFSVATEPLWQRIVVLEDVSVQGARFKFATAPNGMHNWQYGLGRSGAAKNTAPPGSSVPLAPPAATLPDGKAAPAAKDRFFSLKLRSLHFGETSFVYKDLRSGASFSGQLDPFSFENVKREGELPLDFSGWLRDGQSGRKLDFSLAAKAALRPDNGLEAAVSALTLAGQGGNGARFSLEGKGNVTYTPRDESLAFGQWQGTAAMAYTDGEEEHTRASAFTADLACAFAHGAEGFDLSGDISVDTLDLDALLVRFEPAVAGEANDVKGAPNLPRPKVVRGTRSGKMLPDTGGAVQNAAPDQPRKAALPRGAKARLALAVGELTCNKLPLRSFKTSLSLRENRAAAEYAVSLFSGAVTGKAALDLGAATPEFALTVNVRNMLLEEASRLLADGYTLTGALSGSMDVRGKGGDAGEVLHSLQGKASVQAVSGEVRGFKLIPANLEGLQKAVPDTFPYERISASATISQGTATSRDISMLSPALTARGGGTIRLAYGQMDLGLDFLLGGLPPAVPVSIAGPYGSLSYSVDMRTFLRNIAESALQEQGSNLLHDQDARRNLIRGIGGALFPR